MYTARIGMDAGASPAELAGLFAGYSASDIRDACQDAHMRVIGRMFDSADRDGPAGGGELRQPEDVTMADFEAVMARRRPSVSAEMTGEYRRWGEGFGAT